MLKVEIIVQLASGLVVSEPEIPYNSLRLRLWINERSCMHYLITREYACVENS